MKLVEFLLPGMQKKEIIWREILYQGIEKKQLQFTQKELSAVFDFSLSTVFNALKVPRQIGAIKVTGRYFTLQEPEKLLYLWGTKRNFKKDIIYQTHVKESVFELEGSLPSGIVYGAYSAFRKRFKVLPADYDKVYVYTSKIDEIKKRFPPKRGYENLIVLKADPFLKKYGKITTLAHTFVDLWNLPEWYARDFYLDLGNKIKETL
jgi:hypothetical protein